MEKKIARAGIFTATKLWTVILFPVRLVVKGISKLYHHDERKGKLIVGVVFIVIGSAVADLYPEHCPIPHFLWDGVAWLLHGFGCAPIIEQVAACTFTDL